MATAAPLLAVLMLFLGGCGTRVAGRDASPAASEPAPWVTMQPSAVTGARLGDDRRTLFIDAQVPRGGRACARDLKAVYTDPLYGTVPGTVHVQITFVSPLGDKDSGCGEEKTATARVGLPEPLGDRKLVVDNHTVFTADGARLPALRMCGQLGCTPPRTGCTAASYDQALMAVNAPDHTYRDSEKCDGEWLVLDFTWRTGPACDDTTNSACTSRLGDRWFYRAEKAGWKPFFRTSAGGCRDVQRREPGFPTALCASLPPLPTAP